MALEIQCGRCGYILKIPGGILLGPPNALGACVKFHLCVKCYADATDFLED